MQGQVRFWRLIDARVSAAIHGRFGDEPVTVRLIHDVHKVVRGVVDDVFDKSTKARLGNPARSWLTDQLYKSRVLSDGTRLGDHVFTNEYKLADMPYDEVRLLTDLFNETLVGPELQAELSRRIQDDATQTVSRDDQPPVGGKAPDTRG